jgi:hypothetical protein
VIGTIAGIINFDGKPVDRGLVEQMLSSGSVSHTQTGSVAKILRNRKSL